MRTAGDNDASPASRHAFLPTRQPGCNPEGSTRLIDAPMHLKHLQANWNEYAAEDPMWAILTDPRRKGNRWTPDEFFESGEAAVDALLAYLKSLHIPVRLDAALDFGCGLGRLSQALCRHFSRVHGVDIAPAMIEGAKRFNRYGDKCVYHLNSATDLKVFDDASMTLIFTIITLQHIPSHLQRTYIQEFFRLLKPGGVAVFRTLSATSRWRFFPPRLVDVIRITKHQGKFMGAYGLSIYGVMRLIDRAGCELVELKASPCDPSRFHWLATQYCVIKPGSPETNG